MQVKHQQEVLCEKAWQVYANFHSDKDLMGDARCLLELPETCHSQSRTALAPSTRHHNNKRPECNCAPAMLYLTSCSSRKCNMTPLGNQACTSRHRRMLHAVQYVLKLSLLSSCTNFILRSSIKSVLVRNQGTVQQSESTILLSMSFSLDLANKNCTLKGPLF